jgi:peptide/nickel transport system ATP-binding protein
VSEALVEVEDLRVAMRGAGGREVPLLRGIDLRLEAGESLGIVGESGCGKSTLLLALVGAFRPGARRTSGTVRVVGRDILALDDSELDEVRGREIGLVPQNVEGSLTPNARLSRLLSEALELHRGLAPEERLPAAATLLAEVGLAEAGDLLGRYPHELSGGQLQRVAIALALAGRPRVLLFDEPTSALDVTTQAHVLSLLRALAGRERRSLVFVSHDLEAVAAVSDRIAVLYAGEVVEEGIASEIMVRPQHPYTKALLDSIPGRRGCAPAVPIPGRPPEPGSVGRGCAFVDRCPVAVERCRSEAPTLLATPSGGVRCHLVEVEVPGEGLSEPGPQASTPQVTSSDDFGRDEEPALLKLLGVSAAYQPPSPWSRALGWLTSKPGAAGGGGAGAGPGVVVRSVDLEVRAGETLALVGESGSGKSTLLRVVAGLMPPTAGSVEFEQNPLAPTVEGRSRAALRRVQLIFQNPESSLNPRHTVAQILGRPLRHYFDLRGPGLRARTLDLLAAVRLGSGVLRRLPRQLSGGEQQRVAIARAFAARPSLVLCDEITSGLDVSVQAAVLDLLADLQQRFGTAYVLVSHDLALVRSFADRVAVLYGGELVEVGRTETVYRPPLHPYTEVLLSAGTMRRPGRREAGVPLAAPPPGAAAGAGDAAAAGAVEPMQGLGCVFRRSCPRHRGPECDLETPPWQRAGQGHSIACHIPIAELRGGSSD